MANVIDSLVVEVALDPTLFKKGSKEAEAEIKRIREVLLGGGKEIEKQATNTSDVFSKLRSNILGLGLLFTGGLGLKEFVSSVTQADIGIGRMSKVVGVSTQMFSQWRNAGQLAGGTTESFTNVLKTITLELAKLQLTGESSVIPYFRALGVSVVDNAGKFKNATDLFLEITDQIAAKKIDPARGTLILQSMGADEAAISAMMRGRAAMESYLDEAKKNGVVTPEDVKAAQDYNQALNSITQSSANLGRQVLTFVQPALSGLLDQFTALFRLLNKTEQESTEHFQKTLDKKLGGPSNDYSTQRALVRFLIGPHAEEELYGPVGGAGTSAGGVGSKGDSGAAGLRTKADVGAASPGISSLARSLQDEIPGLSRFTAFDDAYHAGTGSAHAKGLALDFTLGDPATSDAVAAQIRAKLAGMGVDAKVLDEYKNPSGRATGGHIHVQFGSAAAAQRFSGLSGVAGASGAAAASSISNSSRSNSSRSETNVGVINIHTPQSTAGGIARDIRGELQSNDAAINANTGAE